MKRPTTINLHPKTRERLERAREQHALGHRKPSLGDMASAAIDRGLDAMLGESQPPTSSAGSR